MVAVAAVLVIGALGIGAALVSKHSREPATAGAAPSVPPVASPSVSLTSSPTGLPSLAVKVPAHWVRVRVDDASYAVPRAWQRRPAAQRTAYREDGAVIASGRGQALSWRNSCRTDFAPVPGGWAVLADPVVSTNPAGVAEATAVAWARGYAGLPADAPLTASSAQPVRLASSGTAAASRVVIDTSDSANPCAGERAELTAVARRVGDSVVTLVVARYLGVRGAPGDAAYAAVLGSLRAG